MDDLLSMNEEWWILDTLSMLILLLLVFDRASDWPTSEFNSAWHQIRNADFRSRYRTPLIMISIINQKKLVEQDPGI